MREKRIPLKNRTKANDIKFKGILSYRHLRIIGWVFLALAQVAVILKIAMAVDKTMASSLNPWITVVSFFSDLPLPLFLLANFAIILQKKENFKILFIKFGGLAIGMYVLANLIVLHYAYGFMQSLMPSISLEMVCLVVGMTLANLGKVGYSLNIFIDLFLFVLLIYFLNYRPKKHFQGNKIKIFRAFVFIPILYEIASIVIKACMASGLFITPTYFFFLLTSKPPFLFLAFVILGIMMKIREMKHLKKHESPELLNEHYETNAHSLRISITIVVIIIICSVLDLITSIFVIVAYSVQFVEQNPEMYEQAIEYGIQANSMIGLGWFASFLLIPIILLFSYKKTHKNPRIDMFIPLAGVAIIAFIYFEGIFLILTNKISQFAQMIIDFLSKYLNNGGSETSSETSEPVESVVKNILK